MYKLILKRGAFQNILEFKTLELANLYRDYHLTFGHWEGISRWVEEKDLPLDKKKFIVDEKVCDIDGKSTKFFRITDEIEVFIEEASKDSIINLWELFREDRNRLLEKTDWTQLADCELNTEQRKEYRAYRSYLRVLPKLYDDSTIISARVYDFEDWKKGKR